MKLAGRDDVVPAIAHHVVFPDDREAIGVTVGQPLQQQRVDDAEDRGVGADADREREDGDDAEPRGPQEQTGTRVSSPEALTS